MIKKTKRIVNDVITKLIMNDSYQLPSIIDLHIQDFRKMHDYSQSRSLTDYRDEKMTREYMTNLDTIGVEPVTLTHS